MFPWTAADRADLWRNRCTDGFPAGGRDQIREKEKRLVRRFFVADKGAIFVWQLS
jgi:hypothetical protein